MAAKHHPITHGIPLLLEKEMQPKKWVNETEKTTKIIILTLHIFTFKHILHIYNYILSIEKVIQKMYTLSWFFFTVIMITISDA